jgi:hypothetical protein
MKTLLEQAFELIRKGEYTTKFDSYLRMYVGGIEFTIGSLSGLPYFIGYYNQVPLDVLEILLNVAIEYEQAQKEQKRQELLKQLEQLN